jgi:hypothetical protein
MRFSKLLAGITFIALTTAACVDTPLPKNKAPVNYAEMKPYNLDIADIVTVDDSRSAALTQELGQKFGATIDSELRKWQESRIQPSGAKGTFSLIIKEANFTSSRLPAPSGIESWFTRDQIARWDAQLNVLVSVEGSAGKHPPAEFTVNVSTSHTVPEEANDHEKSQIYNSMLNELMSLYNQEAEKQMQAYFKPYFL